MLFRVVMMTRVPIVTTHPDSPNLLSGTPANRTFYARLLSENVVCGTEQESRSWGVGWLTP